MKSQLSPFTLARRLKKTDFQLPLTGKFGFEIWRSRKQKVFLDYNA